MTTSRMLEVKEGRTEEAVNRFLASLLEASMVEGIVIARALPGGDGFVPALIRDPGMLAGCGALAPTMAVQSARVLSQISYKMPPGRKIAAVLRSCEIRAVIELAKFLQVRLEDLYLIGIDCPGALEVVDYARLAAEERGTWTDRLLKAMGQGEAAPPAGLSYRRACGICEHFVARGDMAIQLFGYETEKTVGLSIGEKLAEELSARGLLPPEEPEPPARKTVIEGITTERLRARDALLSEWRGKASDPEFVMKQFSTCLRCHNCMVACPLCYCRECVFRTDTFAHEGEQYLRWADRKGALRLPTDTLLFHMIRLSHMASSCVGCGACESACPSRLPVSVLFRSVGAELQELFGYLPGRDVEETPPVACFQEEELMGKKDGLR